MQVQKLSGKITMLKITPLDSNMYLIDRGGGLLIDTTTGYHTGLIKKALDSINLDFPDISCIINTHTHADHMGGNHLFPNAKIMMHKSAIEALKEPAANSFARYLKTELKNTKINVPLTDGDTIRAKGTKLEIIHTPGHTKDSICIYMPEEKYLITGDAIPVRIDKKISSYIKNKRTEKSAQKLRSLKVNCILPGHGSPVNDAQKIKELLVQQ